MTDPNPESSDRQIDAAEESDDQRKEKTQKQTQPNNPLHGVRLVDMLERLVEVHGWEELGNRIRVRCFQNDPSIKSSLKFLRKTQWARDKVERLYLRTLKRR